MDSKKIDKQAVRLHHVSAHFTNGLYPASLLFLLLGLYYDTSYEETAFAMLVVATFASPFTYFSGVADWILRFRKARTPIFNKKLYYGVALTVLSVMAIGWRVAMGDSLFHDTGFAYAYLLLNIIISAIVVYLGYLGGKFLLR